MSGPGRKWKPPPVVRSARLASGVVALAVATVAGGAPLSAETTRRCFTDVAESAGIAFEHTTGARGEKHLRETMGAGVAWLDFDGDGWWDLFWVESDRSLRPDLETLPESVLYRNRDGNGFQAVSGFASGINGGYGQGVLAADLDGDADVDLLLMHVGQDVVRMNRGDGTFGEPTPITPQGSSAWSSSAAAADADGDGDLDLYVTRYVEYDAGDDIFCGDPETGDRRYCDPSLFRGAGDAFLRNLGGGRYRDETAEAGFSGAEGRGLGVLFADLDGDRDPDLYVANDLTINFLFANSGDGVFEDASLISGSAVNRDGRPEAGMGLSLGDLDGDLAPELAVTNFDVETNTLYRNFGDLAFVDVSGTTGFGLPSFNRLAFGIVNADFDHDGHLDFYIANGHIFERPARENVSYRQPDQLLAGDGRGHVSPVACEALDSRPTVARGLAAGDFDNDGDLDLAVQESGGSGRLLRNDTDDDRWIGVRLRGAGANSEAVGARLVLQLADRGPGARWVIAGDSYQSSSDRRVHFGTGGATPLELEITWPDGRRVRLVAPPAARYLVVQEGR